MEAIFLFFIPLFFYLCLKIAIWRDVDVIAEDKLKFAKGIKMFDLGLINESLFYFDKQCKTNPKTALIYAYRAKCHLKLENFYQTIYNCDKAASLSNDLPEVFLMKGICLFQIQDYELALKEFSKAISYFSEKNASCYRWRALTHQKLQNEASAQKDFAQAKKLNIESN
jgi:tetratricopeptide (TPR) repeat protein